MNISSTIQTRSPWIYLAAITAAIHLMIYLSPVPIVALRPGDPGILQYSILSVPAIWSIFIFLRYRQRSCRAVAYSSLATTVLWFLSVGNIRT
ncbi:MAG: hypothetical protein C5B50_02100 [Verrucomicrobia bacterium]|nr:MAG: hypothetical protein C5B50_02100 [Verrucomicrobiota bacterium]